HGPSITLTIMGEVAEQHRSSLSALRAVRLLSRRSHSECLQAMKTADLLYLPLAFCKQSARISLYSLPTKLPEYLASGGNVFFHAPKDSAVFRVAERYNLKPRAATIDPDELDVFLEKWVDTDADVCETVRNAQNALAKEFDIERLAQSFQAAF